MASGDNLVIRCAMAKVSSSRAITRKGRPLTVLGGLTSFGGAGNNYSFHAITQVVRDLRARRGTHGLVLANGDGSSYPSQTVLPEFSRDITSPPIAVKANGRAVIETYTVEFQRNGSPGQAYVIGRLENGERFVANAVNTSTLKQLSSTTIEQIGRTGWVENDAKSLKNLFSFEDFHI
ncbi:Thiolase [Penicillium fimorum]|uniref:Thiolase n=1 Tax=Penicillium fimorum TaxID=1882269 RepID=A0A9X0C829_9EURO|nr:Thiolase [Penicillium fimorum]